MSLVTMIRQSMLAFCQSRIRCFEYCFYIGYALLSGVFINFLIFILCLKDILKVFGR